MRSDACFAGIARALDPVEQLYQLSTFMGHVDPASTAVYLTITPSSYDEANRRFEAFAGPAWDEAAMSHPTARAAARIRFFADHLITVKGLRPASVRSYRDTMQLLLFFARRGQAAARSLDYAR